MNSIKHNTRTYVWEGLKYSIILNIKKKLYQIKTK